MASRSFMRSRKFWLASASFALAGAVFALNIEPMRFRLPYRYLVESFDIQRSGMIDFAMCMKVGLTPKEANNFVLGMFGADPVLISPGVDMNHAHCDAAFWPDRFSAPPLAYEVQTSPAPLSYVYGSDGAVYEDGYLYFWSNSGGVI
ncbi:MAG: hypothetical protein VYD57_00205 [Pseudomonadota bacterium]|nr:hypothetical protein [Pseudomonadota bacterium]